MNTKAENARPKGDKVNKAVKIVIGILLIVVGCLFVARPVLSTILALPIAGVILIIMGAVEIITFLLPHNRDYAHATPLVTGVFKLVLGLLIFLLINVDALATLPFAAAVILAVFGIYRIVIGRRRKLAGAENWGTSAAVGVIAIVGAVVLVVMRWANAMDMIGILIAAIAILYGFVVLLDAFVKSKSETMEEMIEEDMAISDEQNEEFRRFQDKLNK